MFFKTIMGQVAVLYPAFMVWVKAVAVLPLVPREIKVITAIKVVTSSRVIRGVNGSNSLVIRVTRSS